MTGFLAELTEPGSDNAVTSWGGYFGKFSSLVDGLNAYGLSDVRVIEGKDTFGYAETLFRTGANDNGPRASAREYVGSRIGGMSVSSRIPATATSGTLNKHQVNIAALTSLSGPERGRARLASIQRHTRPVHGRGFGRSRHYRRRALEFQNPAGNRLFALRGAERGIAGGLPCATA